MKRKVGELFNKPIVQGNENVLSPNEILVEQKGNTFSLKERVNGEIKEVSGGGASTWRYFDVSNMSEKSEIVLFSPVLAKNYLGVIFSQMVENWQGVSAFGVDGGAKINIGGNVATWTEAMALEGFSPETMGQLGIVEITEEEFYTL